MSWVAGFVWVIPQETCRTAGFSERNEKQFHHLKNRMNIFRIGVFGEYATRYIEKLSMSIPP